MITAITIQPADVWPGLPPLSRVCGMPVHLVNEYVSERLPALRMRISPHATKQTHPAPDGYFATDSEVATAARQRYWRNGPRRLRGALKDR